MRFPARAKKSGNDPTFRIASLSTAKRESDQQERMITSETLQAAATSFWGTTNPRASVVH
jgi:hypothetical protein